MWIAIGDAHGSDRVIVWVATCIGGCGTMVAGNNCWLWQCGVFGGGLVRVGMTQWWSGCWQLVLVVLARWLIERLRGWKDGGILS